MESRKQKAFWIFLVLVNLISWLPGIPVQWYAFQRGYLMPNPQTIPVLIEQGFQDNTHLSLVLLTIFSILLPGTVIAAIVAQAYESGKSGLRGLWKRSTHWPVGWREYGIMLGLIFIIFMPIAIYGLVKGPLPGSEQVSAILIWLVPMFLYTFLASGMEEPGWRGYLLPSLQTRMSAKRASVIVGIVNGIWQWPVFLPGYINTLESPGGVPQAIFTLLIQLALSIVGAMISGALIYTWLYNRTGSTFLCILFHVLHNISWASMLIIFPDLGQTIANLGTLMYWLVAIVLMRFFWVEAQPATPTVSAHA